MGGIPIYSSPHVRHALHSIYIPATILNKRDLWNVVSIRRLSLILCILSDSSQHFLRLSLNLDQGQVRPTGSEGQAWLVVVVALNECRA